MANAIQKEKKRGEHSGNLVVFKLMLIFGHQIDQESTKDLLVTFTTTSSQFLKRSFEIFMFNLEDLVEHTLELMEYETSSRNGFIFGFVVGGVIGGGIIWRRAILPPKEQQGQIQQQQQQEQDRKMSKKEPRSLKDIQKKSFRDSKIFFKDEVDGRLETFPINLNESGQEEEEEEEEESLEDLHIKQKEAICAILVENLTHSTIIEQLNLNLQRLPIEQSQGIKLEEILETHWPALFTAAILVENFDLAFDLTKASSDAQYLNPEFDTSSGLALQTLLSIYPSNQQIRSRLEYLGIRLLEIDANPFGYQPNRENTQSNQEEELNNNNKIEEGEKEKEIGGEDEEDEEEEKQTKTPLELAIERGYSRLVEKLLNHPLKILEHLPSPPRQPSLPTPLHQAIQVNDIDILKKFLKFKSPIIDEMINTKDQDSKTILHLATEAKLVLVFPHILDDPRAKKFVNVQDKFGNTPLHYAAKNKNREMLRLLINEKGDPNITNYENESAFAIAIANGIELQFV